MKNYVQLDDEAAAAAASALLLLMMMMKLLITISLLAKFTHNNIIISKQHSTWISSSDVD